MIVLLSDSLATSNPTVGSLSRPYCVYSDSEAFDIAREAGRPIVAMKQKTGVIGTYFPNGHYRFEKRV